MSTIDHEFKRGDYTLVNLILKSQEREIDIRLMFEDMNIYEDLFNPGMSGDILIKDGLNLQETLPIVGDETLIVKFKTTQDSAVFSKEFRIYKISDTELIKDKIKMYRLHFLSTVLIDHYNTRLSRHYEGYTSDIARQVLTKHLNVDDTNVITEQSKSYKEFVIPNWTPMKTMSYLAANSVSEFYDTPSYVFYENRKGFNFVSLDYLVDSESTQNLSISMNTDPKNMDLNVIENYLITNSFNILDDTRKGMYGSTLVAHDIINKTITKTETNYNETFNNFTHLHEKSLRAVDNFSSGNKLYYQSSNYHNFDVSYRTKEYNSRRQEFENNIILVTVPGNTNQMVGNKVNLNIPSTKHAETVINDSLISGFYLISKIRHVITLESHNMLMECRKDSYKNS